MENVKNNTKTKQLKQFKLQELKAKREQLKEVQEQALANLELIKECEKSSAPHTYELGKNLMKIVKDKLYMAAEDAEGKHYKSFKKYAGDILKVSDKYAYMLINAAKVQDLLSVKSVAPENVSEKLLRKLVPFLNTPEEIDDTFAVNVRGTILMTREFVNHRGNYGRIINLSTDAAQIFPSQITYGASKATLEALTRSVALEVAKYGITVNCVAPGPTQTG